MTYVFRKYRNNEDVLVDLLIFYSGLVFAGLLPHADARSPFPEGVFSSDLHDQLGSNFVNPGVYSPLGEVFEWAADQFAAKHRAMWDKWSAAGGLLGGEASYRPFHYKWRPSTGWVNGGFGWGTMWTRDEILDADQEWSVWWMGPTYRDFLEVLDWVRATRPDLRQIGFRTAFTRAEAWHAALPMETTKGGASRGIVVATWPDGATMERMITDKNLQDEGKAMGHCIAGYSHYATSGDRLYFSYRDASGASVASIEMMPAMPGEEKGWVVGMITDGVRELVDAHPPEILQLRGVRNGRIQDEVASSRIVSWFFRNDVNIDPATGNYLPMVSFLTPTRIPQVLPLRTIPHEVVLRLEEKEPGTEAGWEERVRKDDEQWSKRQLEWADQMVESSDEAEMHGSMYSENKELTWLFYQDEESESRREILRKSWDELQMDIPILDGLNLDSRPDMAEAIVRIKASMPDLDVKIEALTSYIHKSSAHSLLRMLDEQVEHLDLVDKLRDRDWFQEEEEDYATYDPEDQRKRAQDYVSDDSSDCFRSATNFVTVWNKSALTDRAMSEQRDHRHDGTWFSYTDDDHSEEGVRITWLSFGFGYHGDDDPTYRAGDLNEDRPFSGIPFKSPLGALWGADQVISKEQEGRFLEDAEVKRKAFLDDLDRDGMKRTLPRKAVFFDKPMDLIAAATQNGVIVPYAILREFQR